MTSSGRAPSGQAGRSPTGAATASPPSGDHPSRELSVTDRHFGEWIEFYVRTKHGDMPKSAIVPIRFKQPIKLYDDEPHSPYRKAVARAARIAKREIGLHPCSQVIVEPHDWSCGIDDFSEAEWKKQPRYIPERVPA